MSSLAVVQKFIGHVFAGEMTEALALTHAQTKFVSTRPTPQSDMPVYGTFIGPEQGGQFFNHFSAALVPGEFHIEQAFSEGEHVALYGRLSHHGRHTGLAFNSDWAMICRVQNGRLSLYHFYEDTAALESALKSRAVPEEA